MNLKTSEQIAIMQAFIDGKKIQARRIGWGEAWKKTVNPRWAWDTHEYRIASREKQPIYIVVHAQNKSQVPAGGEGEWFYSKDDAAYYAKSVGGVAVIPAVVAFDV